MSARRYRPALVGSTVLANGLVLIGATQPWFQVALTEGVQLSVDGGTAAPSLTALALAGIALAAALALAGARLRPALAIVQLALGAVALAAGIRAVLEPLTASASAIGEASGITGEQSQAELVVSLTVTAWPWLAIAGAALACLTGLAVLVTSRHWPSGSRRYEARAGAAPAGATQVGDWDALSEGRDPTDSGR